MTGLLEVYWEKDLVGRLWLENEEMQFEYSKNWLYHKDSIPISPRLPLIPHLPPPMEVKCFFSNLLPESNIRNLLAKKYGISTDNHFSLLKEIGGECAGALSIQPKFLSLDKKPDYKIISHQELNQMIDNRPIAPLLLGQKEIRMSLAGAQDKLPVFFKNNKMYLPQGDLPSSHIFKPPSLNWKDIVINELFCMTLAKNSGLNTPQVKLYSTDKYNCFLIERYDRIENQEGLQRIHQIDFCQALGLMPYQKYQKEGGSINLKKCFEFVKQNSSYPQQDITQLISWLVFNVITGNCDAHGKNLSLLIYKNGIQKLAPFYDMVCTAVYAGVSSQLAMSIGGEYNLKNINTANWKKLSQDLGIEFSFFKTTGLQMIQNIENNISSSMNDVLQQMPSLQKNGVQPPADSAKPSHTAQKMVENIQNLIINQIHRTKSVWS